MAEFIRKVRKLTYRGINLNAPVDLLTDEWAQRLENIAIQQDGSLQARTGIAQAHTTALTGVHSLSRLNQKENPSLQAYARVAGAQGSLYSDSNVHATALIERATGFSGEQLFMAGVRPTRSPEPWMFVLDSLTKKCKMRVDGTVQNWGIAPPAQPAKVAEGAPNYKVISDFEATTESAVAWTNGGTAGAITTPDRLAAGTLISQILYDRNLSTNALNTSGWCSIVPAAFTSAIQRGMLLTTGVTTAETFRVEDVFEQITSTTIAAIKYDVGTSGFATIQPAIPIIGIRRNMLLRLAATENVRVLSVTTGQDGIQSFRAYLSTTRAAADTIAGFQSIRAYVANTHNTTTTLTTKNFLTTVTTGSGNISHAVARDLSNTGSRPIQPTDEFHYSAAVSDYTKVDEIRFLFDVDDGSFTRNYFYWSIRGNDLLSAIAQTDSLLTAQQRIINRNAIEGAQAQLRPMMLSPNYHQFTGLDGPTETPEYNPALEAYYDVQYPYSIGTPTQTVTGVSQYTEVRVPVKDLIRVGSDASKTLRDVAAIRIDFKVTGSVNINIDAAWIGGTYLLNSEQMEGATPYLYAYAYYNDATGEMSNFSPPIREGIRVCNNSVQLYPTASADSQVTKYIWIRNGGTLNTWTWIGAQDAADTTFTDTLSDFALLGARTFDTPWSNQFSPIPYPDIPRSGVCSVSGTEVTRVSGDTFNVSWARNATIVINGTPCTLYASPSSTSQLSLNENLGNLSNVKFFLPQPLLIGQEADSMFGPYGSGFTGLYLFFTKRNYLIWTNGDDPSAIQDGNMLEVTSGSEVLMAGCIYDGRAYVFSNLGLYEVSSPLLGGVRFKTRPIAHTKGLLNKYCLKVTPYGIVYLADDGIYLSAGGESISLTQETMRPLFPHEGQAGVATNGWNPPDMAQASKFHFEFADNNLYFDYVDTGSARRTLKYNFMRKAWQGRDTYVQNVRLHYLEEGEGLHNLLAAGNDITGLLGGIHIENVAASKDNSVGFTCLARTGADDQGDPEARKIYGDMRVDFNGGHISTGVTFTPYVNNFATAITNLITPTTTRVIEIIDFERTPGEGVGSGYNAKNIGLEVSWTTTDNGSAAIYGWGVSYVLKPEIAKLRWTDWDNAGSPKIKRYVGFILLADTFNITRTIKAEFDTGEQSANIAITHNREIYKSYTLATPVIAHQARLRVNSDIQSWQFYDVQWLTEDYVELANFNLDFSDLGVPGDKRFYSFTLEADTTENVAGLCNFLIYVNGVTSAYAYLQNVGHAGRLEKTYEFSVPFIASTIKIVPQVPTRFFNVRWGFDKYPEFAALVPDYSDLGTAGDKRFYGVIIEALTSESSAGDAIIDVEKDGEGVSTQALTVTHAGRKETTYALTPFIASTVRLVPREDVRIFNESVRWLYEDYPESAAFIPDWTDAGRIGAKFMQGCVIDMDTEGEEVEFNFYRDGDDVTSMYSETISTSGRQQVAIDFTTPFIAHLVKYIPSASFRFFGIRWVFEPDSELARVWWTQSTSHGCEGWMHLKEAEIALISTALVTLWIYVDDNPVPYEYSIDATGGLFLRQNVTLGALKGKQFAYRLESAEEFRLYVKDSHVKVMAWNSQEDYMVARPFGSEHFRMGADI